ncbi:AAA family ATPase [Candidatus Micrarchaeota archaeon]|nr:AAA family ATPase [Candidatus Micrarchaeota archaeon]
MKIIITGTPGTGKTSCAEELSRKLKIELVDIKGIIENADALRKNESGENEVLMPKFRNALKKYLKDKRDWIMENHLLCELKLDAEFVFVFRTQKDILEKRLKKRKYSPEKIQDNITAELIDYCYLKAKKNNKGKLFEVDTSSRTVKQTVEVIMDALKGNINKIDETDYSKELIHYVLK